MANDITDDHIYFAAATLAMLSPTLTMSLSPGSFSSLHDPEVVFASASIGYQPFPLRSLLIILDAQDVPMTVTGKKTFHTLTRKTIPASGETIDSLYAKISAYHAAIDAMTPLPPSLSNSNLNYVFADELDAIPLNGRRHIRCCDVQNHPPTVKIKTHHSVANYRTNIPDPA